MEGKGQIASKGKIGVGWRVGLLGCYRAIVLFAVLRRKVTATCHRVHRHFLVLIRRRGLVTAFSFRQDHNTAHGVNTCVISILK